MSTETFAESPTGPVTRLMFERLRKALAESALIAAEEIRPSTRLVDIVPRARRREVWRQLIERGFTLPPLGLASRVVFANTFSVLARSAAVAWALQNPLFLAVVLPFALVTWFMTRPLAIHPPAGCETVYEAALLATPFREAAIAAGLWSDLDVSAKVRAIFALHLGRSIEEIRPETRLVEIFEC